MAASLTIAGDKELARQLADLSAAVRGEALLGAVVSGAELVSNDAKAKAPVRTGNLRRSIHVGDEQAGGDWAECAVGTDVAYAARIEFGFFGPDARGRVYHQAAHPYLRPACEATKGEVEREIADALRALLRGAV